MTGFSHCFLLPFGELFISQRNIEAESDFDSRYKFTAKELDNETNYNYFGARYGACPAESGNSDVSVWLSVDPMSDERSWLSPYNYCQWNPLGRADPSGALDDWFENEKTGEVMNVKGTSVLPSEEQNKGWVNIGKDDMFGQNNVPKGETGTVYKMDKQKSSNFMNSQGFSLRPKQQFVYEESINETWQGASRTVGEIIKINEKFTYAKKGFVEKESNKYLATKPVTNIFGWTGSASSMIRTLTYVMPVEESFFIRAFKNLGNINTDTRTPQLFGNWSLYPKGENEMIEKYRKN